MLVPDARFPIITGPIVAYLRAGLTSWSSLTVQAKRPETMPKRLLTVRDDGGPDDGLKVDSRVGINGWADDPVDAENLVRDAMKELRTLGGFGSFKAVSDFAGPLEIEDDPAFTYNGDPLTHFYFQFTATVKGT